MTEKSKEYLLKTLVAFALIAFGCWCIEQGGKANVITGSVCFLIGFIIGLVLYGDKWFWW